MISNLPERGCCRTLVDRKLVFNAESFIWRRITQAEVVGLTYESSNRPPSRIVTPAGVNDRHKATCAFAGAGLNSALERATAPVMAHFLTFIEHTPNRIALVGI